MVTQAGRGAMRIGVSPDEINDSWVQRWRTLGLHGEVADCAAYNDWSVAHRHILQQYKLADILNFDESALFWPFHDKRNFVLATEAPSKVHRPKVPKTRMTLLVRFAANGQNKPSMAVETSANPRWPVLPGKKTRTKAPVIYYSSEKGWMTQNIFGKIFADMEQRSRGV